MDMSKGRVPDDDEVTGVYDRDTSSLANKQQLRHDGLGELRPPPLPTVLCEPSLFLKTGSARIN